MNPTPLNTETQLFLCSVVAQREKTFILRGIGAACCHGPMTSAIYVASIFACFSSLFTVSQMVLSMNFERGVPMAESLYCSQVDDMCVTWHLIHVTKFHLKGCTGKSIN